MRNKLDWLIDLLKKQETKWLLATQEYEWSQYCHQFNHRNYFILNFSINLVSNFHRYSKGSELLKLQQNKHFLAGISLNTLDCRVLLAKTCTVSFRNSASSWTSFKACWFWWRSISKWNEEILACILWKMFVWIPLSFEGIFAVNTNLVIFHGVTEPPTFFICYQCNVPQISRVRWHPSCIWCHKSQIAAKVQWRSAESSGPDRRVKELKPVIEGDPKSMIGDFVIYSFLLIFN